MQKKFQNLNLDSFESIINIHQEAIKKTKSLKQSFQKTEAQIEELNNKCIQLQEKATKQRNYYYKRIKSIPYTTKDLLELISIHIINNPNFPTLNHYEILGSFGLNCEYAVFFFNSKEEAKSKNRIENITCSLTFMPTYNNAGENAGISMWTGKVANRYAEGSIGALNGGNYIMEEVTDFGIIYKQIHEQLEARKLRDKINM